MPSIQELKERIDLHDLAERLGLERPGGAGNYRSPHHQDKSPSVSIYDSGRRFKDHSSGAAGSCIDFIMWVEGVEDVGDAVRRLHDVYGWEPDAPEPSPGPPKERSRAQFIADQCVRDAEQVIGWLVEQRGIPEDIVRRAISARTVGYNDWTSPKRQPGEPLYGGPAAAFIVRAMNPGEVVAVDMRYFDAELNGGVKTQTQGDKAGTPWISDVRRFQRLPEVYLVESPINALSVEAAVRGATGVATRGLNVDAIPWGFLRGKQVYVCMDADKPLEAGPDRGKRPGPQAAWRLHELLTELNVACLLVDQSEWIENGWNDVNDVLQVAGADELERQLRKREPWLIPGLPGKIEEVGGRRRVFLPTHDFSQYWRYRVKEDFSRFVASFERDKDTGEETLKEEDVAGFRVQALSRVTVASYTATMTGETDAQPRTLFSASVQVPRHGPSLVRRVFDDDGLHNVEAWKKFGPVFKPSAFSRMLNILERGADLGARDAVNFVGLAWRNGRPTVNQGPDCYFHDPVQQCPYHNLVFPSGTPADARRVIGGYQATFKENAALLLLTWALGGHLKAFLGFWPHMEVQAEKGAGKSTLIKRLEGAIAFKMFSGESIQTHFRQLTSLSHTSHPVGWEEVSAREQKVIDMAVSKLQEAYQYAPAPRGAHLLEFLISAPVLLAGEDVPVRSLTGKLVRTKLSERRQGAMLPWDLPKFPVRQWLEYLTGFTRSQIMEVYDRAIAYCQGRSSAAEGDVGAKRMIGNYAGVATTWKLLCDFADLHQDQGGFLDDLVREMNEHIMETSADREPWVWIVELLLSELAAGRYMHPHKWDDVPDLDLNYEKCLILRPSHVMDHISHTSALRHKWDGLPVKSARVFKAHLKRSGVLVSEDVDRTIKGRNESHMVALGVERLARFGLHAAYPEMPEP